MSSIDRSFIKVFSRQASTQDKVPAGDSLHGVPMPILSPAMTQLALQKITARTVDGTTRQFRIDPVVSDTRGAPIPEPPAPAVSDTREAPIPEPPAPTAAPEPPISSHQTEERQDFSDRQHSQTDEPSRHRFNAAHQGVATGPHWDTTTMPSIVLPDEDATSSQKHESLDDQQPATEEEARSNTESAPAHQSSRPAFEVDRFNRSSIIEKLISSAHKGIQRTARCILDAAAIGNNVTLVTGRHRGEGRTTVALCLASQLAAMNKSVVLVDGDFQHPHLAQAVGISPQLGWKDIVPNELAISEVMIESIEDRFTILPLTSGSSVHFESTDETHLPAILESVRDQFDIVLIDGMPISSDDPTSTFLEAVGPFIDSAVLLHMDDGEVPGELSSAVSQLLSAGIHALGIIRNAPSHVPLK